MTSFNMPWYQTGSSQLYSFCPKKRQTQSEFSEFHSSSFHSEIAENSARWWLRAPTNTLNSDDPAKLSTAARKVDATCWAQSCVNGVHPWLILTILCTVAIGLFWVHLQAHSRAWKFWNGRWWNKTGCHSRSSIAKDWRCPGNVDYLFGYSKIQVETISAKWCPVLPYSAQLLWNLCFRSWRYWFWFGLNYRNNSSNSVLQMIPIKLNQPNW